MACIPGDTRVYHLEISSEISSLDLAESKIPGVSTTTKFLPNLFAVAKVVFNVTDFADTFGVKALNPNNAFPVVLFPLPVLPISKIRHSSSMSEISISSLIKFEESLSLH